MKHNQRRGEGGKKKNWTSENILQIPYPRPCPPFQFRAYFFPFSHQVCWWEPWVRSSDNCTGFLSLPSFSGANNEDRGEREAGMCLPAWNAAGAESWHQLAGKGRASKGCLQDNRVFSLWCIYTEGLKFCESNSCCKNIVLNMLRTVKRVLLMLHLLERNVETCGMSEGEFLLSQRLFYKCHAPFSTFSCWDSFFFRPFFSKVDFQVKS